MVTERSGSCPRCGVPAAAGVRFCPACGQRLGAFEPPEGAGTDPLLARVRAALLNEYDVAREIGRGGMAAVFLAQDLRLPRRVALKVMLPELAYSAMMPQRFVGEARTAAMLDHPNIVPVFHAGEQDGLRYFAMRYIDGCSLERLLHARGPLPVTLACHLLAEIAAALDYAHAQGVVHRDVKPANVMIDRRFGRAIVTDFGIARVADGQRLTSTGLAIGTPEYMSPEQYAGEDVTGASDQYALGAVAFHLLAGRPPFAGTQAEVLMAHLREPPPPLRALRPDVPPVVEAIVHRMLAKAPADRWPSLGELAARFTEHVGSAALAVPAQLIALLPARTDDEAVPQTPVSPVAGVPRPTAEAAQGPTVAPTVEPEPEPDDGPTVSPSFAPYRPVAPAEVVAPPPARRGRPALLVAGGVGVALLAALLLFRREQTPAAATPALVAAQPSPDTTAGTTPETAAGSLAPDSLVGPDSAGAMIPDSLAAVLVDERRVRIATGAGSRPTLTQGDTLRLRARLVDGHGNAVAFADAVRWTSSAPAVAEVSADGLVRALAPTRQVTITAAIGGRSERVRVRILPREPVAQAEPPRPRAPLAPTADEAQRLVEQLAGTIARQRVDELRPLLDAGGAAAPLLEMLRKEEGVQATPHLAGPVERVGDQPALPVRLELSWQNFLGPFRVKKGRNHATSELLARFERAGEGWRVASVQVRSFVRR